jgi:GNAT superfamily N-acetyltransferase
VTERRGRADGKVQRPEEADIEGIFACLAHYRLHLLGDGPLADPDAPADAILGVRNALSTVDLQRRCWVAVEDGAVHGFACWGWLDEEARIAKTVLITVVPGAHERGFGSALQRARMDEARSEGAREIHTWTDDPAAAAWYESDFGYRAIGREPLRHSLHRFTWGARSWWAIHRGLVGSKELTHLVCDL